MLHLSTHTALLDALRDRCKKLPKEISGWFKSSLEDQQKLKKDVAVELVRSRLFSMHEVDEHMVQLMSSSGGGRLASAAVDFVAHLLQQCILQDSVLSSSDLSGSLDVLAKIAARPGSPEALGQLGSLVELTLAENCLSAVPASTGSLRRLKDLDLRGNPLEGLPAGLLTDTPLQHLQLDERLLAKDGSLREDVEGREAYAARRKARIDKELHGKATGGDVNFSS